MRHLESVVFDLGETLVDETRQWSEWADWLGVSTFTLFGAMGAAIAGRRHHLDAFETIRPGFDLDVERAGREAAGRPWRLGSEDLYPDAVPCLPPHQPRLEPSDLNRPAGRLRRARAR